MPDVATPRPQPPLVDFEIGEYSLTASTTFGPRLLGLRYRHGPELFAQLGDDAVIEHPDSGTYRFHGGHRLWAAPEIPAITYASDDHPCAVTTGESGFTITAPMDAAGLIKQIRVGSDGPRLLVDHHLANAGPRPIAAAPWGITQFRLGGSAIIPTGPLGDALDQFQAHSSFTVWPYTNLADPRLAWRQRAAIVGASPGPRFKIGAGPSPGHLGYLMDRQLFTKSIVPAGTGTYPDRGAVAQVFVDDSFCELESVGPITSLQPGSSISHREIWEVSECPDLMAAYGRLIGETRR